MSHLEIATLLLQAGASLVFGMTILVVVRYLLRWKKDGKGYLPLHIWLVAFSYDLLLLGLIIQTTVLVRWWHYFLYVPAVVLGIPAMFVLSHPAKQRKPRR